MRRTNTCEQSRMHKHKHTHMHTHYTYACMLGIMQTEKSTSRTPVAHCTQKKKIMSSDMGRPTDRPTDRTGLIDYDEKKNEKISNWQTASSYVNFYLFHFTALLSIVVALATTAIRSRSTVLRMKLKMVQHQIRIGYAFLSSMLS